MALPVQYFVNHKTRMCNMLSGRGEEQAKNVKETLSNGFVEVTQEEMDSFREDTAKTIALGWNPNGRTSYAKFLEKLNSKK